MGIFIPTSFGAEFGGVGGFPANPNPEEERTEEWFIYTLNPGESVEDAILVRNTRHVEVTVRLYPADYVQSTDGGFALEQEVEPRDEVGAWVELSETLIVLPPMSETTIPFKLTVPEDASLDVGEHMGGILIQEVDQSQETSGGLQLTVRSGVRIYVTIPGEIVENIQLTDFKAELNRDTRKGVLTISIKNKGNVGKELTLRSNIEHVFPFFNRIWKKLPQHNERVLQVIRDDELVSNFEFDLPWFSYARFSGEIEYTDRNGEQQVIKSDPFHRWILPPQQWLIRTGVSLMGSVLFLVLFISLRRRAKKKKSPKRKVKRGLKK